MTQEIADDGPSNFIREIIEEDLRQGKNDGRVVTRFPPEPNGYLHVGHVKAIVLNFGMAEEFGGHCNLRFDDTNPAAEEQEYVDAIREDIRWLGYDWGNREYFASDYFDQLHAWAIHLIENGKAYVDSLTPEQIREYRGDYYTPGRESPYRNRSVEENLDLFRRMRKGEFKEGECVLRAKIDMKHGNLNMRDPLLYRIKHATHHRTGDKWCIYPMYDFAHGQSDAIEHVTHSLCTLEFEDHRPLYDWFLDNLPVPAKPRQIEFARLNLTYTVLSKRKLLHLVKEGHVRGWDDPRMPTISGMRRRGFSPAALRKFCERIGVSKRDGTVDVSLLEHAVRGLLRTHGWEVVAPAAPRNAAVGLDGWGDRLVRIVDDERLGAGDRSVLICEPTPVACASALRRLLRGDIGAVVPDERLTALPEVLDALHRRRSVLDLDVIALAMLVPPLDARQHAVLQGVLNGQTTREIAANGYVSVATVKRCVSQLYRAFGVRGTGPLTRRAATLGFRARPVTGPLP